MLEVVAERARGQCPSLLQSNSLGRRREGELAAIFVGVHDSDQTRCRLLLADASAHGGQLEGHAVDLADPVVAEGDHSRVDRRQCTCQITFGRVHPGNGAEHPGIVGADLAVRCRHQRLASSPECKVRLAPVGVDLGETGAHMDE